MARRRQQKSPWEELLDGPWQLAAAFAVFLLLMTWLLPVFAGRNIMLHAMLGAFSMWLEIAACVCGVVAFVKWVISANRAKSTEQRPAAWQRAPRANVTSIDPRSKSLQEAFDRAKSSERVEPHLRPRRWSLELLQSLDWKRFEEVAAAYFCAHKFRCVTQPFGPDGGIDGTLYFGELPDPVAIFQCKAWTGQPVGVKPVRELLGVMTDQRVKRAYLLATGEYTPDAVAFGAKNQIKLITGRDLLAAIAQMDEGTQARLLALSTEGDYTTPTCASCGKKMVLKTIGGKSAWGCPAFPRCRSKPIFRKAA